MVSACHAGFFATSEVPTLPLPRPPVEILGGPGKPGGKQKGPGLWCPDPITVRCYIKGALAPGLLLRLRSKIA
jgi:hypothetical protein